METIMLSEHFSLREFYDPTAYKDVLKGQEAPVVSAEDIDPRILLLLEALRARFRTVWEDAVILLTPHGGYRPDPLNTLVGGAAGSRHRFGNAADIKVKTGEQFLDYATLAVYAEKFMAEENLKGGIGAYPSAPKSIHVDARGRNVRWFDSYSSAGCPGHGGVPVSFKKGTKGAGVVIVQRALNLHPDGKFGETTEKALRVYQASHNLVPDGIFGRKTNEKMGGLLPW